MRRGAGEACHGRAAVTYLEAEGLERGLATRIVESRRCGRGPGSRSQPSRGGVRAPMPSEWAPPIPLGWAAAAAAAEDGEAEEEEEAAASSAVAAMSQELSDRRPTQGMPSPAVALLLAAPA